MHVSYIENNIAKQIASKIVFPQVGIFFCKYILWKSSRFIHNVFNYQVLFSITMSWNWYKTTLRFAQFRGSKLPNYNPLMIFTYILYSFSFDEFFLMISHRRFLMRQYKYKCLDMPYHFLLIFFPLGFKRVFSGTSYCTLCNIHIRYMSYLLFFPFRVFRRNYTWHICYSLNSLMRFFSFQDFSHMSY
jgi:hypothetical protein